MTRSQMHKRFVLTEVCEKLGVERHFVVHCLRAHWVVPIVEEEFLLDEEDLARVQFIRDLVEFGVNDEAIPVILDLVDQLNAIQNAVRIYRIRDREKDRGRE